MSTYTDLHKRLKENVSLDSRNRITTQEAKFLNANNEFWGTFVGQLSSKGIAIDGGTLKNVTIDGVMLTNVSGTAGEFKGFDSLNDKIVELSDRMYDPEFGIEKQLNNFSGELGEVKNDITSLDGSISNITLSVNTLNGAILNDTTDNKIKDLSIDLNALKLSVNTFDLCAQLSIDQVDRRAQLSVKQVDLCAQLSVKQVDLCAQLSVNKVYADVAASCNAIEKLINESSSYLDEKIDDLCVDFGKTLASETSFRYLEDSKLSNRITSLQTQLTNKLDDFQNDIVTHKEEVKSTLEQASSYIASSVDERRHYNLVTKSIGSPTSLDDFAVNIIKTVSPLAVVAYQDNDQTVDVGWIKQYEDGSYSFTAYDVSGTKMIDAFCSFSEYKIENNVAKCENGYKLKITTDAGSDVSDWTFKLEPSQIKSVGLTLNDSAVGSLYSAVVDTRGNIVSAQISYDENGELSHLKRYDVTQLTSGITESTDGLVRWTLADNKVITETGYKYVSVTDPADNVEFARYLIPAHKNETTNEIVGLSCAVGDKVNYIYADSDTKISTSVDGSKYSIMFTNNGTKLSTVMTCVSAVPKYSFCLQADDGNLNRIGTLSVDKYNADLGSDAIESINGMSIDISQPAILNEFKKICHLSEFDDGKWKYVETDENTHNLLSVVADANYVTITMTEVSSLTYMSATYIIDHESSSIANPETSASIVHQSPQTDISSEYKLSERYECVVADETKLTLPEYYLQINSNFDTNSFICRIPSKTDNNISREFEIAIKLSGRTGTVNLKLVNSNGDDVYVVDSELKTSDVKIYTGRWCLLKMHEIANGVFHVVDVDENAEDERLNDIINDIGQNKTTIGNLSAEHKSLIENLSAEHKSLNARYSKTFVQPELDWESEMIPDNLVVMSQDHNQQSTDDMCQDNGHSMYEMIFKDGTLVLKMHGQKITH